MKSLSRLLMLAALAVLSASQARAEFVDYSYHWTVAPSAVLPGGTGSVVLAPAADGPAQSILGNSTPTLIPGATVTTTSSAVDAADAFHVAFDMTLTLTDAASNLSSDLKFTGTIDGQLTPTSSTLTSKFNNPLTQTVTLGNHVYTVTIDPALLDLPAPNGATPAAINALVTVDNKPTTTPPPQAPEPSSLVLGATAVLGVLGRRWIGRSKRA